MKPSPSYTCTQINTTKNQNIRISSNSKVGGITNSNSKTEMYPRDLKIYNLKIYKYIKIYKSCV